MVVNTKKYIETYLKIRSKESEIIPFKLNPPQQKLYDAIARQASAGKPVRVIVLKARQMGFSTLTEAIIFKKTATAYNVTSAIVTQKDEATTNLFEMSKRYYANLPEPLKPKLRASNAKELIFDTREGDGFGSRIKCFTAGGEAIGRSDTIQNLHVSELAFWAGDKKSTLNGLMQSVPNTPNSLVVVESTANGYDYFKQLWDRAVAGESDFVPVFCAWWELDEYRMPAHIEFYTPEEEELRRLYGLDDEQLAWRRWQIANSCGGDVDLFKQEYPANPTEAFLSTGSTVFDKTLIVSQLEQKIQPVRRGRFCYRMLGDEIVAQDWEDDERGEILLYALPKPCYPYVIGGDTAGEGSDRFTGQVLDNTTGGQVAVLRQEGADEDLYARQMVCLARYYNDALLGIEANFSTYPIREVERLGYRNQYVREQADTYTGHVLKSFGFKTTSTTRPTIIAELVKSFREAPEGVVDGETLKEMLVFVRNERGRAEAMQGEHDDLVMALAIAHGIRGQQSYLVEVKDPERKEILPFALQTDDKETEEYMEW